MAIFPRTEWVSILMEKLNADERYGHIARNWEGDILFQVDGDMRLPAAVVYYLDLWHGKCRDAYVVQDGQDKQSAFRLIAPYENYVKILKGDLDPMQAMLTRKLSVQGNMAVLMRSVPTVLDFVRCCREVTDDFV